MREIKFKVVTKDNSTYQVLGIKYNTAGDKIIGVAVEFMGGRRIIESKEIKAIIQYIGLHDKVGKEIYEGNIVKDEHGMKHIVEIKEATGGYHESSVNYIGFGIDDADLNKLEIIGNIYKNPRLLDS